METLRKVYRKPSHPQIISNYVQNINPFDLSNLGQYFLILNKQKYVYTSMYTLFKKTLLRRMKLKNNVTA